MTLDRIAMEAFANFETDPRPYDLSSPHIFVADSHHKLIELPKHFDSYRALEILAADVPYFDKNLPGHPLQQATALVLLTCGWVAPGGGCVYVAPSKHPMRRRVRFVVAVDTNLEMAGVAGFEDNPDEIDKDLGGHTGRIKDALNATMEAILAYQKNLGLRK